MITDGLLLFRVQDQIDEAMAVNWMPNKQHPMRGANPSLRWSNLEPASAQLRGTRAEDNKRTRNLESTITAALVYAFDSPQFPSSQRSIQARSRMRAVGADLRPIWFGGAPPDLSEAEPTQFSSHEMVTAIGSLL